MSGKNETADVKVITVEVVRPSAPGGKLPYVFLITSVDTVEKISRQLGALGALPAGGYVAEFAPSAGHAVRLDPEERPFELFAAPVGCAKEPFDIGFDGKSCCSVGRARARQGGPALRFRPAAAGWPQATAPPARLCGWGGSQREEVAEIFFSAYGVIAEVFTGKPQAFFWKVRAEVGPGDTVGALLRRIVASKEAPEGVYMFFTEEMVNLPPDTPTAVVLYHAVRVQDQADAARAAARGARLFTGGGGDVTGARDFKCDINGRWFDSIARTLGGFTPALLAAARRKFDAHVADSGAAGAGPRTGPA